jgi:hypothetical protein
MEPLHSDCLLNMTCDDCNKQFCKQCCSECDCEHMEVLCPHCIKVYNINYDNREDSEGGYCESCFNFSSDSYNICYDCLISVCYCFSCNVVYCEKSKLHDTHSCAPFFRMNSKCLDKFKECNDIAEKDMTNVNIRHEIIELICDDIQNIDTYIIKYEKYFKTDITYGSILYDLVNYNYNDLKWYIEYLISKKQDIKLLLNTNVSGRYETSHLGPPIAKVTKLENLKLLVSYGSNIHSVGEIPECNCLHTNIAEYINNYNHIETMAIINYLIYNGVDVNVGNPLLLLSRRSRLHKDVKRQELIKLLISKGSIVTDEVRQKQLEFFSTLVAVV